MGKRFEASEPTFMEMLEAFQTLGLTTELGKEGPATAFASTFPQGECLEFTVVQGSFSAKELMELRAWAA